MYSGGLDSTGVLYKLLTDDQYKDFGIHAHSMDLLNIEGRSGAEYEATTKCIRWFMRNCREFEHTRSTYDCRHLGRNFTWDTDISAFTVGQITSCTMRKYVYVAMGKTKTDELANHANLRGRIERAHNLMRVCHEFKGTHIPEYIYPVANMTKREIWEYLPEELRVNTWSCRNPILREVIPTVWLKCGKCITCVDMQKEGIYVA